MIHAEEYIEPLLHTAGPIGNFRVSDHPEAAAIRVHRAVIGRRTMQVEFGSDDYETKLKRAGTSIFVDRARLFVWTDEPSRWHGCPTSLRAQNADEVYGSCASRGQQ